MIRGFFDGASRGNPGPAGAGAVICEGERVLWRRALPLGTKTNNEAEYAALDLLLGELERRGARGAEVCGDSRLVISQVTGAWQIKEPRLRELALPLIGRLKALGARCLWVPRERNAEADRLSNLALDSGGLTEDAAAPQAPPSRAAGSPAPCVFRRAAANVWLAEEGEDVYAVDLAHRRCTCGDGSGGKCRHIERLLEELSACGSRLVSR